MTSTIRRGAVGIALVAVSLGAGGATASAAPAPGPCQPADVSVTMTTSGPVTGALSIAPAKGASSCVVDGFLTDVWFSDGGYRRLPTEVSPGEMSAPPTREVLNPGGVLLVNLRWQAGRQGEVGVIDPRYLGFRLPGAGNVQTALWLGGPVQAGKVWASSVYSPS